MKTKISHLGRSTVSVILAVMMLLSTMLIGTVSTVNAATTPLEEGTVVYVQVKGGNVDWYVDTNNEFSAWVWGGTGSNQWVQLQSVPGTDNKYFYFVVPEGGITSCILHRKSNTMKDGWNAEENYWNTTGNIQLSNIKNLITIKDWNNSFSNDSCYQIDSTAKLDADSASVKEGTPVTFTPSLTSNTDFNDIKSVSYTVKKDSVDASSSDYSIDGSKITFNKAGNYEVTANVIYNAKGFSDITKIATATTTVKVESSLPHVAESVTLTALPETVKVGNSVTLTPTVSSAKPGNLTYTYNKITGGTATEVKNADNSLTVTPTVAGTYKYTVTVSADGYSPVTSNEVSFTVTAPVDYYLAGRIKQNGSSDWVNSIDSTYKFTQSDTEGLYYYKSIRTPKRWSDTVGGLQQYFYIIDSSSKMYGSKDNSSSNTPKILYSTNDKSTLEKINSTSDTKTLTYINNQEDTSVATFWLDTRNNEYKLWYTTALPHTVTVAEGVPASVDKTEFAKGETVTVTATSVPQGQILDTVTVMGADKTPVTTTVSGNSATFTMPDQNVTVTKVTFRKAKEFKVTIASDITYGTVKANDSPSEITVTEGTPVRLVATPNDSYYFSSWSITPPDGYTAKDSMTSATETIYPTNNITVSASFTQGTESTDHFLAWGDKAQYSIGNWTHGVKTYSSKDKNGDTVYTAELDPSFFEQNAWYCFAVTNKIPSSGDRLRQDDLLYNNENTTVNGYKEYHDHVGDNVKTERKNDSGNYFGMFQYYSGKLESLSISYNEGTHNYQVTPVIKVHNEAKLYAKNGSCRTDGKYPNNMHEKGITTISYNKDKYVVDVDDKSSKSYQLAYLSEENIKDEVKLTITTKVTDSEYYLAGWCVDGETYLPKTSNTESNEYSFDYYVKSTTKPNDIIEVTPVYFYRTSTGTETVRFYVTGFDDTVKKDWGNTIAVYPYYSGGKGDVFSNYPGQPMLVSGGRCYVDLPIKYNGGTIAGVTLNNYYFDDVHKNLVSDNRQTYDYNDFLKIYEQKIEGSIGRKSQEIIFSFKYVPSDNSVYNNNFGDKPTNKGDKTSDTYPDTILAKDMEKVYKNGWEDLTDFYGNKVDLYNRKVEASSAAGKKNPWRVISNGYEQTYFGYYATRWAVYKPNAETGDVTRYSLVDVISSSSLLYNSYEDILADTNGDNELSASSDAEAYNAFKVAGAEGVPVKITYEQTILRGKSIEEQPTNAEYAYRNDGRWYYSEDNLDVTAHTVIEYADTLNGFSGKLGESFFRDYYQKDGEDGVDYTKAGYDSSKYTGLKTKTSAYFTNEDYYQKTEAKGRTGSDKTFDIIANTDHTSQYIFVGWYLLSEGKYSPLTSTVENSVSVPQDNNDVYVARFIKAPSGSLTISHTLHPDATGLGKCYVSVDVLNSAGAVIHHYDETTSDITVSNAYITYNQGNKIKITLKTEPGEASTFNDFYSYSNGFAKLVNTQTGEVPAVIVTNDPSTKTYKAEISFNVDYLFNKDSTDHPQNIKVLNYYSLLSLGSVKYEIRYTFDTRLYGTKVYKVSDVLTKEDIEKYGCTETKLSEKFVMAKAPFESNFKQNITWDSNQIIFDSKDDGTLTAVITATQVEDKAVTATFHVDSDSPAETITTDFGNRFFKNGSYISAKPTGTTADVKGLPDAYKNTEGGNFSFWYVMTKNGEFVTKAYGQNFAYTGYDNYIVVAVYGVEGTHKDTPTDSSINFLQYSRNHWNDTVSGKDDTGSYSKAGTEYDRLYADFNLMFNHNGFLLNKYSGTPNIKVGYAMVVGSKKDGDYIVDETELQKAISDNATDGGTVEHQSTSLTARQAVSVTNSDNDDVKKNVIVNSIRIADLDNKNRITSYYGFKNSEANQSYYVQVYSYVIVGSQVTLSETPVVINLNDIGNKTYEPQQ